MTPYGVRLRVPLPPGSEPGHVVTFTATMPSSSLHMPCAIATPKPGRAADYEVCVPPQLGAGERFKAILPDTDTLLVTVPPGGTAGTLLSFRAG